MDAGTSGLILATTADIEGHPVSEYLGIVSGEAMVTIAAGSARAPGGAGGSRTRSATVERRVNAARDDAIAEMASVASEIGASAVISIRVDFASVQRPEGGELLIITASGTTVVL